MAKRVKVKLNSPGMAALLKSAALQADLHARAERVAARARATAPVRSGAYAASIFVFDTVTDRAVARIATSAPHGLVVEANTGNLAKALGAGA